MQRVRASDCLSTTAIEAVSPRGDLLQPISASTRDGEAGRAHGWSSRVRSVARHPGPGGSMSQARGEQRVELDALAGAVANQARSRFRDFAQLDHAVQTAVTEAIVTALLVSASPRSHSQTETEEGIQRSAWLMHKAGVSATTMRELVALAAIEVWKQLVLANAGKMDEPRRIKLFGGIGTVWHELAEAITSEGSRHFREIDADPLGGALREVLNGELIEDGELQRRCERLGLPRDASYALAIVIERELGRPGQEVKARLLQLGGESLGVSVMVGEGDAHLVVIAKEQRTVDLEATLNTVLQTDGGLRALVAGIQVELSALASVYSRLMTLLPLAREKAGRQVVVRESDVAVEALIETVGPQAREYYLASVLGPLLREPSSRRRLLLETWRAISETPGGIAAAASALGVHAKTVQYRVHQIGQLTRLDPYAPADRFKLMLALRLLDARLGSIGSPPPDISP